MMIYRATITKAVFGPVQDVVEILVEFWKDFLKHTAAYTSPSPKKSYWTYNEFYDKTNKLYGLVDDEIVDEMIRRYEYDPQAYLNYYKKDMKRLKDLFK